MAAAAPANVLAQSPEASSGGLEEIVVTARKKEESILDTPIAITALTGDELATKGVTNFNQLADATPGLNLTNVAGGGGRSDRSFQQITLRGFVPSSAASTLVSTFIDGAPVASPTAVGAVNDPARVEILKGPQAAYFGRNTFAGAINVVNRLPGEVLGGSFALMGGSRSNVDVQGAFDGPLFGSDSFGFRVSAHYFKKDGSYDNVAQPGETLGDQETRTVSALLTAKPTENFSAKAFVMYSENDDGPSAQGVLSAYEIRAFNGVTNLPAVSGNNNGTLVVANRSNCSIRGLRFGDTRAFGPAPTDNAFVTRPYFCGALPKLDRSSSPAQNTLYDGLAAASMANPSHRVVSPSEGAQGYGLVSEYWHTHLNLDYTFGESGFTLSSTTALNDEFYSEIADLDNVDTRLWTNPNNVSGTIANRRTFFDFIFAVERQTFDFSQELRLSYDKQGKFSGLIGASMIDTNVWNNLINISNEVMNTGLASGTRNELVSPTFASQSIVKNKAVFFGGTYKFTDALRLSFEGRYQEDRVIGKTSSNPMGLTIRANTAAQYGLAPGFYPALSNLVEAKYPKFLPRLIVQYDLNPDVMTYASYSKGINVGTNTFNTGFLTQSELAQRTAADLGLKVVQLPEQITNYEIGLKGRFLDDRLQVTSALYYALWKDQLNSRSVVIQDTFNAVTNPSGINTAQLVSGALNTGDVKLQGIEVDLLYRPIDHVDLNFAAAYTDSSIKTFVDPTTSVISGFLGDDYKGNQLPFSSKISANAGAQYNGKIASWEDGSWFARADVSYKDKMYLDQSNLAWTKARTVVNFRGGITRGPMGFEVFVLNAFDDDNYTGALGRTTLVPNAPGDGTLTAANTQILASLPELRVVGARFTYKF